MSDLQVIISMDTSDLQVEMNRKVFKMAEFHKTTSFVKHFTTTPSAFMYP